jgi:hypothetical protein
MTVQVERIAHSGALRLYTLHDGHLVERVYYGYSKSEAVRKFRRYLKGKE